MTLADLSLVWITTRAAGIVALVASTASIVLGLALAGRVGSGRRRGILGDVRVLHQALGVATLTALAVHVGTLLADPWLKPSLGALVVPFTLLYRPLFTGLGIIAGYGILVAAFTGFLGRRLGKRWNVVHRSAAVVWVLSVIHTIGAGTDGTEPWMLALLAACVLPVLVLLAMRLSRGTGGQGAGTLRRGAYARVAER